MARQTRRQRANQVGLRAAAERVAAECWLCHQPIDYAADASSDNSFSADHVMPYADHPELREDPANLAPAHLGCNRRRGKRAPSAGIGQTSRQW